MSKIVGLKEYKDVSIKENILKHLDCISDESDKVIFDSLNDIFNHLGFETIYDRQSGRLNIVKDDKYYNVQITRTGLSSSGFCVETSSNSVAGYNSRTKHLSYDGIIYVSRSYFSDKAKEYDNNSERVTLIDRKKLFELLSKTYPEISMNDYYDSINDLENCRNQNCSGKMIQTTYLNVLNKEDFDIYYHCLDCGMKFYPKNVFKIIDDNL